MTIDSTASRLAAHGVAFAPEIAAAAARHGLDPTLLAAVAAQETGGPGSNAGRNIVGDGGHGHGLFQIDDRWHDFATGPGAMDPARNADYAAGMLSGLLARYGGDVRAALSAYNAGSPTAAGTRTTWADGTSLSYADSVARHYRQLDGGAGLRAPVPMAPPAAEPAFLETLAALAGAAQAQPPAPASSPPAHFQRKPTDYAALLDDTNP